MEFSKIHSALRYSVLTYFLVSALGCSKNSTEQTTVISDTAQAEHNLLSQSVSIAIGKPFTTQVDIDTPTQRLDFDVELSSAYASISIYNGETRLVDNIDIAKPGMNHLNVILDFENTGLQPLTFITRSANITLSSVKLKPIKQLSSAKFTDISADIGFITEQTYKYGGPAIADVDNDGDYDFALNNHNYIPTQLVINDNGKKVSIEKLFPGPLDYHGSSFGDYDNDGDLDLMIAMGGANGTNPTSYALMNNADGKMTNVSAQAGITTPARGRSPRWIDFDLDGDLDIALFNAKIPNDTGPQQVFYRNKGDGTFEHVNIAGLEFAEGERVVVNDYNNDGKADILLASPTSLWRNDGNFTFTDVSNLLPESVRGMNEVVAATDVDVNNDGLYDFYLARGKSAYQLSRKSIDFNPETKRLDIRDDGEAGTTHIRFTAADTIHLSDMDLTFRQYWGGFAIFLGADKVRKIVKAKGFQETQLPEEMKTAADFLDISKDDAQGWPEVRDVNGLYIGHIENNTWQAEWVRDGNIYWQVTFSLTGLNTVEYDWTPNNRNVQDVLLINNGDKFVDASAQWNIPAGGNHVGVTHGDFNNDGWNDLMIYRYGFLKERMNDLILLNTGKGHFEISAEHGARDENDPGHGDMGQAFDFDLDGRVDLLNGSEEEGHWYLYKNATATNNHYVLVDVGYSPEQHVDSYSAFVQVSTESGKKYSKRVGSAGEVHSQSQLSIVHFGLGEDTKIKSIEVVWRNGETKQFTNVPSDAIYSTKK